MRAWKMGRKGTGEREQARSHGERNLILMLYFWWKMESTLV